jgi:hypothetical protein
LKKAKDGEEGWSRCKKISRKLLKKTSFFLWSIVEVRILKFVGYSASGFLFFYEYSACD